MMIVVTQLEDIPPSLLEPCALTIGSFDGVHLGHQLLLKHMRKRPLGTLGLLTFSNHPATVLPHRKTPSLLCSLDQKLKLLNQLGVNLVILLEFSKELAECSYDLFLKKIQAAFPFHYLVLGEGARLGKGQEGNEEKVKKLGETLHFEAEYLKKMSFEGEVVSSGRIRQLIESADFKEAERLLGRPYSIYTLLSYDFEHPEKAWINLKGRCLPRNTESYEVSILHQGQKIPSMMHFDYGDEKIFITFLKKLASFPQEPVEILFQ